jgi:hypothetical protein
LGGLPVMVLPLIITNIINPETTAYYYMAMMVATLLFVIPQGVTQSLFAEGSYDRKEIKILVKKTIQLVTFISFPAILATIYFGKYVLFIFGKNYSSEGLLFLQILALSGIPVSINSILITILKVRGKISKMIFINFTGSMIILGLSYLLISWGLLGIGLAWIIGQCIVSLIYLSNEGWRNVVNYCYYFVHNNGVPLVKYDQVWSIGIYTGTSPLSLDPAKNIINPVITAKNITDVPAKFVADPFMIKVKSTWYMFFEVMTTISKRGEIGCATSDDGFCWKYRQVVLKESFHLSYPYVFEWEGECYMIPESYESRSIRLYKSNDFPTKWSLVKILLQGKDFVDSSIFHFQNMWWLFTTSTKNNTLYLYYSDKLTGVWKEHPKSPVIIDNSHIARPCGRVVQLNGHVIRYTQDDATTYGKKVMAFEITELTTTKYAEKPVEENPILQANRTGWNAKGMHHIDPHQIEKNDWIACVDGNVEIS